MLIRRNVRNKTVFVITNSITKQGKPDKIHLYTNYEGFGNY